MSIPKVKVPITLGGATRNLVMDYNAWCEVEKLTGKNPFAEDASFDLQSPNNIRVMLWAGLRHEAPTLTLDQVGVWLNETEGGFTMGLVAVAQALEASLPDPQAIAEASAEGNG
jgi:hypothetical protein